MRRQAAPTDRCAGREGAARARSCYPDRVRARLLATLGLLATGCVGLLPSTELAGSWGTTSCGVLPAGVSLPDRGEGFVRARPGESTRWGTPRLVSALTRASAEVWRTLPGGAPTRIGDLSAPLGGRHHRHASHRTGRDADVLFHVTDPTGRPAEGRAFGAFGRYGHAIERGASSTAGPLVLFDDARNWHLVRTLVLDGDAAVQWIFVSRGLKTRLLRHAIAHERDPRALVRAAYVLQQPENAAPHDDHFHVRVLCTPAELAAGCQNVGPVWPWIRADVEKPECRPGASLDDAALVAELSSPIDLQ